MWKGSSGLGDSLGEGDCLSVLVAAATSYCLPGRHANVVTPCLLTPCLNLPLMARMGRSRPNCQRCEEVFVIGWKTCRGGEHRRGEGSDTFLENVSGGFLEAFVPLKTFLKQRNALLRKRMLSHPPLAHPLPTLCRWGFYEFSFFVLTKFPKGPGALEILRRRNLLSP